MKKGKIAVLLIIIVLLIIGIIVIVNNSNKKSNDYKLEKIEKYSYFKLYKENQYGVINASGKVLIDAKYNVINIPNPTKEVFICYYDQNKETGTYKTKVLNAKNEEIFTEFEEVLPLICENSTTKIPFEKSVLQYKENGKYGIIDFNGNKITDAKYDEIKSLEYREGSLKVKVENKTGLINIKGDEIIKPEYDNIKSDQYYTKDSEYMKAGFILSIKTEDGYKYGYADKNGNIIVNTEYGEVNRITEIKDKENIYLIVSKNGKKGVLKNNQVIIDNLYEKIEYSSNCNVYIVTKNSKQGVLSFEGKEILNIEYDNIVCTNGRISAKKNDVTENYNNKGERKDFSYKNIIETSNENFIITIDNDDKFGLINKDGQVIIKNEYSNLEFLFEKYFIATQNGKVGVIDTNKNIIIDFTYDIIQKVKDKNILQAIISNLNTVEIYNNEMKKQASMKNITIYSYDNYIKVLSENDMKYFDNNGNIVDNKQLFKNHKLFSFNKDGKWGFIDSNDNIIVEAKYDLVTELNQYGYAGIKQDGLWGVIDETGKVILEPKYKINGTEPDFISKYFKANVGFGFEYYTEEVYND